MARGHLTGEQQLLFFLTSFKKFRPYSAKKGFWSMPSAQHSFPLRGFIEAVSLALLVSFLSAVCYSSGGADRLADFLGCLTTRSSSYNIKNYVSGEDFIFLTIPFAAGFVRVEYGGDRKGVEEVFGWSVTFVDSNNWWEVCWWSVGSFEGNIL
jgi:hypothetical protein